MSGDFLETNGGANRALSTEKLNRREFLRRIGVFVAGLSLAPILGRCVPEIAINTDLTLNIPETETITLPFEERIQNLINKISSSTLSESSDSEDTLTKPVVIELLGKAIIAEQNFEVLENRPETEEIKQIKRKKFSNPDIKIDELIFFIRDRRFLYSTIQLLEKVRWSDLDRSGLQKDLWYILSNDIFNGQSAEEIIYAYSVIGTEKGPSKVEISEELAYDVETSKKRAKNLKERSKEILANLPLPNLLVRFLLDKMSLTRGYGGAFSRKSDRPDRSLLKINLPTGFEKATQEDFEGILIRHEAAHSFDIVASPKLMRFLSVSQIARLTLLREKACFESFTPTVDELLRVKQIRGGRISTQVFAVINEQKAVTRDQWLSVNSKKTALTPEEFNLLIRMSPDYVWSSAVKRQRFVKNDKYELPSLRRTVIRQSHGEEYSILPDEGLRDLGGMLKRIFRLGSYSTEAEEYESEENVPDYIAKNTPVDSWEKFLEINIKNEQRYKALQKSDQLIAFGARLLIDRMHFAGSFDDSKTLGIDLKGQPSTAWQSLFDEAISLALAEDLVKIGASKQYYSKTGFELSYEKALQNALETYHDAEEEGFADGIAFALFLSAERGQNPENLNSPYWYYFKELRGMIGSPNIKILP